MFCLFCIIIIIGIIEQYNYLETFTHRQRLLIIISCTNNLTKKVLLRNEWWEEQLVCMCSNNLIPNVYAMLGWGRGD